MFEDVDKAINEQCNYCKNQKKNPYILLDEEQLYSIWCGKGINPSDIVNIKCKEYINMISNK